MSHPLRWNHPPIYTLPILVIPFPFARRYIYRTIFPFLSLLELSGRSTVAIFAAIESTTATRNFTISCFFALTAIRLVLFLFLLS